MMKSPTNENEKNDLMMKSPTKARDCQQDARERLNNWLNVVERRIYALLDTNDPESMKPAEREQAASRYLMLLLHLLPLRQQYAVSSDREEYETVIALLRGTNDEQVTNAGYTPMQDDESMQDDQ